MPEYYVKTAIRVEADSPEEALQKAYDAQGVIHETYWKYKDLNDDESRLGITHIMYNEVSVKIEEGAIPEGFMQVDHV